MMAEIQDEFFKKALRTNKPDSVTPTQVGTPSFIWTRRHRRVLAAYPPARASNPSTPTKVGASPVYMTFQPARFIRPTCCQAAPCALTARFHPYHSIADCGFWIADWEVTPDFFSALRLF
jgi:hypothetical protein